MDPRAKYKLVLFHQPVYLLFINRHSQLLQSLSNCIISKTNKFLSQNLLDNLNYQFIGYQIVTPLGVCTGLYSWFSFLAAVVKYTAWKIQPTQYLSNRTFVKILFGQRYLLLVPIGVFFSSSLLISNSSFRSPMIFFNRLFSSSSFRTWGSALPYPGVNPSTPSDSNFFLHRFTTEWLRSWRRQVSVIPFSSTSRRTKSFSSIEKVLRLDIFPNLRWTQPFSIFCPTNRGSIQFYNES